MNFKEYEEKAITTRVYDPSIAVPYVALGLCGEIGEFFEKLAVFDGVDSNLIKKEIGDVLWYTAALRVELDLEKLEWPMITEIHPLDGFNITAYCGAVAEQIKKYLRDEWKKDEEVPFPEERKKKIHAALSTLLSKLQALSIQSFGSPLQKIAEENIEKLAKRKEQNLLHGSGDERGE